MALALLETLNDIGASEYLGVQTLTLSIFTTWLNRGSLAGAAQMACLMLLIVAALIGLERYGRRRVDVAASVQDARLASRIALAGPARWVAPIACLVPVVLGFLLPAGYLAREVIVRGLLVGFDTDLVASRPDHGHASRPPPPRSRSSLGFSCGGGAALPEAVR